MNFKIPLIGKLLLPFNIFFAGALILSYFSTIISPAQFWPISFFGLAYPVFLIINLIFVGIWGILRNWMMFMSLFVILIGWNHLTTYFSFNFSPNQDVSSGIKIMSYNVQNFDLYNWNRNIESRNRILKLIEKNNPDIICFQDFYTSEADNRIFDNIPLIKKKLSMPYHYFEPSLTGKHQNQWGMAIFSKYPIVKKGVMNFEGALHNMVIFADLSIEGKIVRVFNLHLQSIYFGKEDYEYIEKVRIDQEPDLESSKMILRKLKRAFVLRSAQAKAVSQRILGSPHPVIVVGDFNDTPVSYTYKTVSNGLQDAFLLKGSGISKTYAGNLPGLRIDYILFGKEFRVLGFNRIKVAYSDHFPVISSFEWIDSDENSPQ